MPDDIFTSCDKCHQPIRFGNALVTVNRNVEQVDSTTDHPDGDITVIDMEVLLSLCATCGNKITEASIRSVLDVLVDLDLGKRAESSA